MSFWSRVFCAPCRPSEPSFFRVVLRKVLRSAIITSWSFEPKRQQAQIGSFAAMWEPGCPCGVDPVADKPHSRLRALECSTPGRFLIGPIDGFAAQPGG